MGYGRDEGAVMALLKAVGAGLEENEEEEEEDDTSGDGEASAVEGGSESL